MPKTKTKLVPPLSYRNRVSTRRLFLISRLSIVDSQQQQH